MNCREYGTPPYKIVVVHGGPGARGSCAGICRELSKKIGVLEILQSKNTINELIDEIVDVIKKHDCERIILIGHSFGAWLSFIFASAYPNYVEKLILVGSGLFDAMYYPQLVEAASVKVMPKEQLADVKAANQETQNIEYSPYTYCLAVDVPKDNVDFNEEQCRLLMSEIIPMRDSGKLLNLSQKIVCPVVAIHGINDPHIVDGIKIPLEKNLSDFKMHVLEKCGHEPWKEYYAKDKFYEILNEQIRTL